MFCARIPVAALARARIGMAVGSFPCSSTLFKSEVSSEPFPVQVSIRATRETCFNVNETRKAAFSLRSTNRQPLPKRDVSYP
jgi:hypothetical protein